ncbi:MAG TPA: MupA/Atu3671 family FMN-dependent luciferase-like monooxygenase, partial [Polyangiaceae bacterium]|nr:MupA/Atu3671 family FMN-dependent luciferase-like monooxygenase [Polyangiaceae bacterium]
AAPQDAGIDAVAAQEEGALGLLALLRAVLKLGRAGELLLRVVARDTMPDAPELRAGTAPVHATMRGLLKAFAAEKPTADVRFVDADPEADLSRVVASLLAPGGETECAVRAAATYVPRLVRTLEQTVTDTRKLDPDAAYLVTGGTGGLGLRMARWLLSRGARHLLLLGRRHPSAAARVAIESLERLGAEVTPLRADVADAPELERVLAGVSLPIRGIVHAAGVLDDAKLEEQTPERFNRALSSKVHGTLALERATRSQPLDFMLLFSSAAALLGSPAQGNYAAANAFLDAYAAYRGPGTTSVWWGPWAEVGMAAEQSERARGTMAKVGFEPLRPTVAVELNEQILRSPRRQVAVFSLDWGRYFKARKDAPPLLARLHAELDEQQKKSTLRLDLIARLEASDAATAVALLTEFLAHKVAEAAEIPVEAVDRGRRLSELGLDSLVALNLQAAVEDELGATIPITRFMEDVSLAGLATELRPMLGRSPTAPSAAQTAQEPAAPSTDHAARELLPSQEPGVRAPERVSSVGLARRPESGLELSLFYFSRSAEGSGQGYRLLVEGARFADENGLRAVWLPERHFHEFGGLYPNPSVLASHLAAVTSRIRLRAGSVVLPLHHPLRVAEEWAVVDNLSGGRVDLSFVRGWGPNDFALAPGEFERRGESLPEKLELVRRLWRGEAILLPNGLGKMVELRSFPRPVQPDLPVWLTCTRDDERFLEAGRLGVNVLTALLLQSPEDLERRVRLYREARARHGFDPRAGHVTLMLHTYVGEDERDVLERVRTPLQEYLKSSLELWSTGS